MDVAEVPWAGSAGLPAGRVNSMNDSTALVTGGNKGIGKEIARQLVAAGFTVHVGSRDRSAASGPLTRSAGEPGSSSST